MARTIAMLVGFAAVGVWAQTPPQPDAESACKALNLSLKIELMHGFGRIDGYSRNSGCGYECGRQTFRWDNGPQGFSSGNGEGPAGNSTQWPSTVNMAATWDPTLASKWGVAMGEEWWAKGTNIFEGPGINVLRAPRNGRTFEYVSGEDPVLGKTLVVPLIDGVQQNAMAIAKHYILNNQETDRSGVNEIVDEKTIMELYSPPFEAAAARVAGYMCAYNRINGNWACENPETLKTMLKGYFNFSGFVVSDWGACHSTIPSINNGLDIQMPDSSYFNEAAITAAIAAGNITEGQIHDSCVRILKGWYAIPPSQRYPCNGNICINNNVSTPEKKLLARNLSAMSTVLLQNKQVPAGASAKLGTSYLLPLKENAGLTVALIGSDAKTPYTAGQGSGGVDNSNVASTPYDAFVARGVTVLYSDASDIGNATATASAADVAIVFASAHSGEGHDRVDLKFTPVVYPDGKTVEMENVIKALAGLGSKTKKTPVIVSAVAPGPLNMADWAPKVEAILVPFLPGEQYGNALADLLFGDVVPQAKLPVTMPLSENDQGMSIKQFPGIPSEEFPGSLQVEYSEGQINGYRWYDKNNVTLGGDTGGFPFGFGLTYGSFSYSNLKVTGRTISMDVSRAASDPRTGGCDTPQFYFSFPTASTDPAVPLKVLRYFEKVCTDGTVTVSYDFTDRDVSNWDVASKQWVVTKGVYTVWGLQASQGGPITSATFTV